MAEPRSNTGTQTPKATRQSKRQEKPEQKAQQDETSQAAGGASAQSEEASLSADGATIPGRLISLTAVDRDGMISVAAYYRAEQRNFEPGNELEDWLEAEAEINALLLGRDGEERSPF